MMELTLLDIHCRLHDKLNINTITNGLQLVVQYRICPGVSNIWSADNPVDFLNEHLSVLVRCYVPCNQSNPYSQQG